MNSAYDIESRDGHEDLSRVNGSDALPPECIRAIEEMGSYLASDLEPSDREQFIAHIRNCGACHEKLMALELVIHLARKPL